MASQRVGWSQQRREILTERRGGESAVAGGEKEEKMAGRTPAGIYLPDPGPSLLRLTT